MLSVAIVGTDASLFMTSSDIPSLYCISAVIKIMTNIIISGVKIARNTVRLILFARTVILGLSVFDEKRILNNENGDLSIYSQKEMNDAAMKNLRAESVHLVAAFP